MRVTLLGTGCPAVHPDRGGAATLIAAGRGCDLLVHEVFLHHAMRPEAGVRDGATISAVASYHTLSSVVGRIACEMDAAALALTHFVPPVFDRTALLAEVARCYDRPVIVGEDLTRIDLLSGVINHGAFHARAL